MKAVLAVALVFLVGSATCRPFDLFANLGNINKVSSVAKTLGEDVQNLISSIENILKTSGKNVSDKATALLSELETTVKDTIDNGGSVNELISGIMKIITKMGDQVGPDVMQILNQLKEVIEKNIGTIGSSINELFSLVNSILGIPNANGALNTVAETVSPAANNGLNDVLSQLFG